MKISATNTQKTVLSALHDGWALRYVSEYAWCLFQPGRKRPFARVKDRTVDEMTESGWLTAGTMLDGIGYRPSKDLAPAGKKIALQLEREEWASADWQPHAQAESELRNPLKFREAA